MMKRFFYYWLPVLGWMIGIFYLSNQPNLRITPDDMWDFILRKGAHMFVFATLHTLFVRAVGRKLNTFAFLLTLLYAISDEIHQGFVANRHPAATDILFDTSGIVISFFVWKSNLHQVKRQKI